MRNVWIVLKREFLERVRTKSFVIGTVLFPVFMAALFILPALLGSRSSREVSLAVVNEADAATGEAFRQILTAPRPEGDRGNTYQVEPVPGDWESNREALNARVLSKELDGYVVLPANVVETSEIAYRARNISSFTVAREIRAAASQAVQAERLRRAGLEAADVQALLRRVELRTSRITEAGEEAGSAEQTFFLGYVIGFMVYMLTLLYGINVLRSVLEEKTNRIVEVIISSMRAEQLMLGKVLGVASVALLQVGIWVGFAILGGTQSQTLSARVGLPPGALDVLGGKTPILLGAVAFFILGFFLYSGMFAALGAAVNSEQEAQQLQMVVMMPLIASLIFIVPVINDPLGQTATIMGMIPFTAPVVMPMRLAAAAVPTAQIAGSLVLLLASVLFVTWLAGKIYRVGILSTGKKPTVAEMIRWLRAA